MATVHTRDSTGPLTGEFARHVDRTGLIPRGTHVLAAVSGGLDSTVLLHLLREVSADRALRLSVAHFDHGMRPGSAEDAAFVRSMCASWDVPCLCGRASRPLAGETRARAARYAFLHDAAEQMRADRIATGHHADDQVETVLLRLIRGTGVDGLAGIPERRGALVRPLLHFRRTRLLAHARASGLRWREDPTNADPSYTLRNRVRLELLPALERTRPGASTAVLSLARDAGDARAAWRSIVAEAVRNLVIRTEDGAFQLARDAVLEYHPHVRARVIRHLARRLGAALGRSASATALEFIETGGSGKAIPLRGGLRLERHFDRLVLRPAAPARPDDRAVVIRGARPGRAEAMIGGRRVRVAWRLTDAPAQDALALDAAALRFPIEVRGWRPGDRIRLRAGTRKLKKLFAERRVARPDRDRTPVVVQGDGRVVGVAGLASAADLEPVPGSLVFEMQMTDAESS